MLADRVQWFRARAQMERWEEEVEIVEEEFRRTVRSFEKMASVWNELGVRSMQEGHAAYAFLKAHIFEGLAHDCREKFEAAGGSWPNGRSLAELVYAQQQSRISGKSFLF
jgi:hypothetical protein